MRARGVFAAHGQLFEKMAIQSAWNTLHAAWL